MSMSLPGDADGASTRSRMDNRLREIVRAEGAFIWRILRRLGLSPSDADDASQQVFMTVATKLSELQGGRERAFLYGVAVKVAANARRARRRRPEAQGADLADFAQSGPNPEEDLEQREELRELDRLLGQLPDELRRILILADIEGLTGVEIAALENLPPGTVASRLRRARELLTARARLVGIRCADLWEGR